MRLRILVVAAALFTVSSLAVAASRHVPRKVHSSETFFRFETDQGENGKIDLTHHFPNSPPNGLGVLVPINVDCNPGIDRREIVFYDTDFSPRDHTITLLEDAEKAVLRFKPQSGSIYHARSVQGTMRYDNGFCDSGKVDFHSTHVRGPIFSSKPL